jgi:hypothetical protein
MHCSRSSSLSIRCSACCFKHHRYHRNDCRYKCHGKNNPRGDKDHGFAVLKVTLPVLLALHADGRRHYTADDLFPVG